MATEKQLRNKIATWLNQYKGIKEGSAEHKEILAIFNDSGLCTRYKMSTSDAWCAAGVSADFIANDLVSIFPCIECSCANMITLAQAAGIWEEDDAYVPSVGDVILYDWDDGTGYATSDNKNNPDHVGIVQSISGDSFTVIECNISDTVGTRSMTVNGRYIRGYILPDYKAAAKGDTGTKTVEELAYEVIAGEWGNGSDRKEALEDAGYDYEAVQAMVNAILSGTVEDSSTFAPMTKTAEPDAIWDRLYEAIGNAYGAAGLMGNLYAESALIPINLQNSYESKLGYSDEEYTEAVDNGTYTKFSSDSAGYGLAQWTYSTRKAGLKECCDSVNASIGNLTAQLDYLLIELKNDYKAVWNVLVDAASVKEASDKVLTGFEKPADQSDSVKEKRAAYGQTYYDMYADFNAKSVDEIAQEVINGQWGNGDTRKAELTAAGYDYDEVQARVNEILAGTATGTEQDSGNAPSYVVGRTYKTKVDALRVRTGPGTAYSAVPYSGLTKNARTHAYSNGTLKQGTSVTCKAVTAVSGDIWMKIPSGWVAAYYGGKQYIG